jgi:hypothetical protein
MLHGYRVLVFENRYLRVVVVGGYRSPFVAQRFRQRLEYWQPIGSGVFYF